MSGAPEPAHFQWFYYSQENLTLLLSDSFNLRVITEKSYSSQLEFVHIQQDLSGTYMCCAIVGTVTVNKNFTVDVSSKYISLFLTKKNHAKCCNYLNYLIFT